MDAIIVKDLVKKNSFKLVLEADQLKQQYRIGNVFKAYKEGLINFPPTYKYDPGTNDWDSRYVLYIIHYIYIINNLSYLYYLVKKIVPLHGVTEYYGVVIQLNNLLIEATLVY